MKKTIRNTIIGAIVIIFIAQSVNAILAISSFENTYRNSLISNFRIIARDLKRDIETGVDYGKAIHLFHGMDDIFETIIDRNENVRDIFVTLPGREVLYSTDKDTVGNILGADIFPKFESNPPTEMIYRSEVTEYKGSYFISLPVYYNQKQLVGSVHLQFSKRVISERVRLIIQQNARFFLFVFVPTLLVVLVVISLIGFNHIKKGGAVKSLRRKNSIIIVTILVASQFLYAGLNNNYFRTAFIDIFNTNINTLSSAIKGDIERVLRWDIPVERLSKAEELLSERLKNNPEAESIAIAGTDGNVLYKTDYVDDEYNEYSVLLDSYALIENQTIPRESTTVNIIERLLKGTTIVGYLSVAINEVFIQEQLNSILFDAITVIMVAFIVSFELIRLMNLFITGKEDENAIADEAINDDLRRRRLSIIRLTSFTFFFAALVPLSFLPILIQEINNSNPISILGSSQGTLLSLPISSYMIGIAIIILILGFISHTMSIRTTFLISMGFFAIGSIYTAYSPNIIHLIIARFIAGLGYGGGVINGTNLIVKYTDSENRTTGFGSWSAGFASGTICAIAIGGVIVNRLGFKMGMFVTTAMAVLLVLFVMKYIKVKDDEKASKVVKIKIGQFFEIFRNRSLVANLFFSSVPIQLAYIGLFQYVFPLFMNDRNISQANIGRILMIYGLIALMTPFVSRMSDRIKNEKLFIVVGNLITGIFLLSFFLYDNIVLMIITILAMGFGSMMVDAVNESFIASSKEARAMGEIKILSIYATYEKIVGIVVPILAGVLITSFGFSLSIGLIGIFTLVASVLFAIIGQNTRVEAT